MMTQMPQVIPPHGLGARRTAELERRVGELRNRARQCRDLADSALSEEGKATLSELAFSFQSEANALERLLAANRDLAD